MPANKRVRTKPDTERTVLTKSRRRCCLCFGLHADLRLKKGQVAHIDHDRTNSVEDNLAFLCLDHHDEYDAKRSQAKGLTEKEVKYYRGELYSVLKAGPQAIAAPAPSGALKLVDVGFVEDGTEKPRVEDHPGYDVWCQIPGGMEMMRAWATDPKPSAGELPLLDIKLRNTGSSLAVVKRAVFHVKKTWQLCPFCLCFSELKVSANYDVIFCNQKAPYVVVKPLSQVVAPNEADRFTMRLRPEAEARIILAHLSLIYDEDDKVLDAGEIVFAMRGYDNSFWTASGEKLRQEKDEKLKRQYKMNNSAKAALCKMQTIKSKVVRAFEEGVL